MLAKWDRIILAGLISLLCYGATLFWYRMTASPTIAASAKLPVAFVTAANFEVQRKPASRQVWQQLGAGDPIFDGEAVRTSAESSAKLNLTDGGQALSLEADTLVVINKKTREIELDLLDGRLLVEQNEKSPESGGLSLTLRAGESVMDLSKASARLSKGSGDRVDVQVLKGNAQLRSGEKVSTIVTGARGVVSSDQYNHLQLQILSPADLSTHYLDTDKKQPLRFAWGGIGSDSEVRVYLGKTLKDLQPFGDWVPAIKGNFTLEIPAGTYNWKLVARQKGSSQPFTESPVDRFTVVKVAPAFGLKPVSNTVVTMVQKKEETVLFSWQKPEGAGPQNLEIASDLSFKNILKNVKASDGSTVDVSLAPGIYYWRVLTHYEGRPEPAISQVSVLTLKEPEIRVDLAWLKLKPGERFHYVGKPSASFSWKAEQPELVHYYKFKIAENAEALRRPASNADVKVVETKTPQWSGEVSHSGTYLAAVEAYGRDGKMIGQIQPEAVVIEPLPLMPAPRFEPETGDLLADQTGHIELTWGFLDGATEYWVTLKDSAGKEVKKSRFFGTNTSLESLLPGDYRLEIYAIDSYGRKSQQLAPRLLKVPDSSGLEAPKLKKVKVQ